LNKKRLREETREKVSFLTHVREGWGQFVKCWWNESKGEKKPVIRGLISKGEGLEMGKGNFPWERGKEKGLHELPGELSAERREKLIRLTIWSVERKGEEYLILGESQ